MRCILRGVSLALSNSFGFLRGQALFNEGPVTCQGFILKRKRGRQRCEAMYCGMANKRSTPPTNMFVRVCIYYERAWEPSRDFGAKN